MCRGTSDPGISYVHPKMDGGSRTRAFPFPGRSTTEVTRIYTTGKVYVIGTAERASLMLSSNAGTRHQHGEHSTRV